MRYRNFDDEYTPIYKANREWQKDIKFNKRWYHLSSVFDNQEFDFNQPMFDCCEFDFNMEMNEKSEK